jgi:hypothetical protein
VPASMNPVRNQYLTPGFMKLNDASLWPSDLGPLRFVPAVGEFVRPGQLTLETADGTELAFLYPLYADECAVEAWDGRGTTVVVPAGSWELTLYDAHGSVVDMKVLAGGEGSDDESRTAAPGVRAWAILMVLWSLQPHA